MVLIAPLVSDLVKSVWSAPSISIGVLILENERVFSLVFKVGLMPQPVTIVVKSRKVPSKLSE